MVTVPPAIAAEAKPPLAVLLEETFELPVVLRLTLAPDVVVVPNPTAPAIPELVDVVVLDTQLVKGRAVADAVSPTTNAKERISFFIINYLNVRVTLLCLILLLLIYPTRQPG